MKVLGYGRIKLGSGELAPRLGTLSRRLEDLIAEHSPEVAALEALYHGVNTKSLIVLAQARGALIATLARQGIPIGEYAPAEVKAAVTGSGRADKAQVERMVRLILGLGGKSLEADASDALAVAICYAQRLRFDRLDGRQGISGT